MRMFFRVLGVTCACLSAVCFLREDYLNGFTFGMNVLAYFLLTIMSEDI